MARDYYNTTFHTFLKTCELSESVDQSFNNADLLDAAVYWLTNYERVKQGLKTLRFHPKLRQMAILHSKQMQSYNFCAHENPHDSRYRTLVNRLDAVKDQNFGGFMLIGENVALIPTLKGTDKFSVRIKSGKQYLYDSNGKEKLPYNCQEYAQKVVESWMNSPGHRANILRKDFEYLGCGCSASNIKYGKVNILYYYLTQNFGAEEVLSNGMPITSQGCSNYLKIAGNVIPLILGQCICGNQMDCSFLSPHELFGEVIEKNGKIGLRNLTTLIWTITLENGSTKQVNPGRGMPIRAGLKIKFGGFSEQAEII